jgi:lactate dehydrogenase-like 2-hydroxyacid dehydrogenase
MHHTIVALERVMQPLPPTFNFPADTTYTLEEHETTPTKALLHARIRHATIIIVTTLKIDAETLSPEISPNLRLVAVMATGTDPVDLDACKKRGIHVTNSPAANLDAVSEHAISLYFAARRRTVRMDALTREVPSPWKMHGSLNGHMRFADGKPPLTCKDEVLGVVGYGGLGK